VHPVRRRGAGGRGGGSVTAGDKGGVLSWGCMRGSGGWWRARHQLGGVSECRARRGVLAAAAAGVALASLGRLRRDKLAREWAQVSELVTARSHQCSHRSVAWLARHVCNLIQHGDTRSPRQRIANRLPGPPPKRHKEKHGARRQLATTPPDPSTLAQGRAYKTSLAPPGSLLSGSCPHAAGGKDKAAPGAAGQAVQLAIRMLVAGQLAIAPGPMSENKGSLPAGHCMRYTRVS
jgi:hypothetical protein